MVSVWFHSPSDGLYRFFIYFPLFHPKFGELVFEPGWAKNKPPQISLWLKTTMVRFFSGLCVHFRSVGALPNSQSPPLDTAIQITEEGAVVNYILAFEGFCGEMADVSATHILLPTVKPMFASHLGKHVIPPRARQRRTGMLLNTTDDPKNISDELTSKDNEISSYFDLVWK